MSAKSILGTLSPLYGAISGEGAMGKMLNPSEAARIAKEEQDRQAMMAEQANIDRQAAAKAAATGGMKKGGRVRTASQRADGIAKRGKTRA
jgi:general stress protein YciG